MIDLPKGLVIPRFEDAKLISLRVVDIDKLVEAKVEVLKGSDADFDNVLCYENEELPLFYFKDDVQAWLCDQECYDICNTLVCDDISNAGDKANELIENAPVIFYLKENGVVEKLDNAIKFDTKEYKNLFELHQNGIEIREQILENLPKKISEELPKERDVSPKIVNEKTKKITDGIKDKLKAKGDAIKDEMKAEKDKAMAQAEESLAKVNAKLKAKGLDPIALPKETPPVKSDGFMSESEVAKGFDSSIAKLKVQNAAKNLKIDDKIMEIQKAKEEAIAMVQKGNLQYEAAQVKLAEAKVKLADPIPDWAKKMMVKAGIDPADPHKKFTRELVIEYHEDGKSLAGKNLSKLDLSKLDLKGIDLKGANLKESDFSQTNLSDASLEKAIASKADFTKAVLNSADISNAIFKEAILEKVSADNLKAKRTLFEKVEIKGSKFRDADLSGAIFKDASVEFSDFNGSNFKSAPFLKSKLSDSVFDNAQMSNVAFSESTIDDCQFIHVDSQKMLFNKSKALNSDFSHSRLYNMRILKESSFEGCNLSDSNMERSTIFEASMKKCNLQKNICNRMLIKTSKMLGCDFRAVQAKDARFEFNDFAHCNLAGINLLNGSLRRTFLQDCDLSHANLYSVEFFKIKLHNSDFSGANLKKSGLENRLELIND